MVTIKDTTDYLKDLFFVSSRTNGIREGFRRLGIIIGIIIAYYMFDYYSDVAEVAAQSIANLSSKAAGAIANALLYIFVPLFALVSFFIGAGATKLIGWVIEGFVK